MKRIYIFLQICLFYGIKGIPLNDTEVVEYLESFGYLTSNNDSITQISDYILHFQEFYNLTSDGNLNEETLNFMQKPRCGNKDNPYNVGAFRVIGEKWNKTDLKWHFNLGNDQHKKITERAFKAWESVCSLNFIYSYVDPDIVVSFASKTYGHNNCPNCRKGRCSYNFDGKGKVLAHATYPNRNKCTEIHLDKSEDWYLDFDTAPDGKTSLYATLIHEIGHVLGLDHSQVPESIMYAYYDSKRITLSRDDINAVDFLYGPRKITPEKTTEATTPKKRDDSSEKYPDLCKLSHPDSVLITSNNHMYIFHDKWVWMIKIGNKSYRRPLLLTEYININALKITNIYQKSDDTVVVISNDTDYEIGFPDISIKNTNTLNFLSGSRIKKVNTVFNTYTGKTIVFYQNHYYAEINNCDLKPKMFGLISEMFPGIPADVTTGFRYINGFLYFLKDNIFYEYNEFSKKLERAGVFTWSVLGIECPSDNLLNQLKNALNKLLSYYNESSTE